jgi:3-deoxy-7-phosphoheptulonate synthase
MEQMNQPKPQSTTDTAPVSAKVNSNVPFAVPYKKACRHNHPSSSVIEVHPNSGVSYRAGNGYFGVIAGPCTVESEEQVVATARYVKHAGGHALRGGAYKPRTNPYSFQGLKEQGLRFLDIARKETGLAIVTEVLSLDLIDQVASYADILQIGSRNMQNYSLLEAVGKIQKPVLLKRGLSATLDEFLQSAEYILNQGCEQVILCERGIRTFETDTRFTLALGSVPVLQQKTHLPVIVDPSHATGQACLIAPMSRASLAAGADGLIIEVHPHPEKALVDGNQSITPAEFHSIMQTLHKMAPLVDKEMNFTQENAAVA